MKIGIIFAAYNCEEFVDKCLEPWFSLRDTHDLVLTVTSGRFSDYQKLGIPNKNKETLKKLVSWDFDYLSITGGEKLLDEDTSRNRCLEYLKPYNCDLIWLVDLDEFYTQAQILSILDYVRSNQEVNNFWINFKNYTIRYPLFLPWSRPTLYRNNIRGGISNFYFDSYFSYLDGTDIKDETKVTIPKEVAFVDHMSWVSRDAVKDKIKYQNIRYCGPGGDFPLEARCSFKWDQESNRLEFNDLFYKFYNTQIPVLRESGLIFSSKIDISFDRNENRIDIFNFSEEGICTFLIEDFSGSQYGSFEIHLTPGVSYWINPTGDVKLDLDPECKGIRVRIFKNENEIHSEKLHFKFH
jgi:hypothetical protein